MSMIGTMAYSDRQNKQKALVSHKNGLALPEIVEYGNDGESAISLIDVQH